MNRNKSESAARPERRLIDVRAVAHKCGDPPPHTATIPRWVAAGILPQPIRLGHLVRWWEDEIDAALAKMPRSDPTAKPAVRPPQDPPVRAVPAPRHAARPKRKLGHAPQPAAK
jgi:predicted DNA-binding transcriptional regulator AlpA